MKSNHSIVTLPKWAKEIAPQPKRYVKDLLKTFAFSKMKEYERKAQWFQEKYKAPFSVFQKKAVSGKKENTRFWDDYIVWKGIDAAYQKWAKRYEEL